MQLREIVTAWYAILAAFYATVALPVRAFSDQLGLPLVSALLFGLLGALAPCQLTTNADALAYLLGKAAVYTALGGGAILIGRQFAQGLIPVIVVARKAFGPLMLALGLVLLGLVPLRLSLGQGIADWLAARSGAGGPSPSASARRTSCSWPG